MDDVVDNIKNKLVGLKGLASIGLADIIGNAITVLFWFYIASRLDPHDYGQIQYFLGIAGTASYISLIGTQNTITVYTAKNINVQSTLYLISLLVGLVSSIAIMIIFYRIDVVLLLFGYIINTLAIGELLGRKDYTIYARYTLIQKGLTLALGIGFYFAFGANGIIFALALSYIGFSIRIYKRLRSNKINFSLVKQRSRFIANNYFLILAGGLAGQADKLVIAPLLGFAILGNYSLAVQFFGGLMIFSNIIYKYIVPEDSSGNLNRKLKIYTVVISVIITTLGITLLPYLIPAFFPKFTSAVEAIQIMSLAIIPTTMNMIYVSKFLASENSRILLIASVVALSATVSGTIAFGHMFGTRGVASAFVLSASLEVIFLIFANHRQGKLQQMQ
ncbi:lipopolysaccharide biosynthesis protein [Candidatus Nitrosotenuis aquarius]|uniref:lipopolysaccharide biosynthesis protein n=1 Tax=Candidatus Nitrosotenuis aquarius TaxID=1846278 RepID=UPI000C1F4C55|nr:hypothetical protein [Candidatus Nitrosotenuis aquarius]